MLEQNHFINNFRIDQRDVDALEKMKSVLILHVKMVKMDIVAIQKIVLNNILIFAKTKMISL